MKRIINRKKYDTDTATEISSYNNGLCFTDFNFIIETLYKKRTGEFFLAGEGGAFTRYAHRCPDGTICGGAGIVPLSIDDAKDWVEMHANRKFEDLFGEVTE